MDIAKPVAATALRVFPYELRTTNTWAPATHCNVCRRLVGKYFALEYYIVGRICDSCAARVNDYVGVSRRQLLYKAILHARRLPLVADVQNVILENSRHLLGY
jgi:hypothetical protein